MEKTADSTLNSNKLNKADASFKDIPSILFTFALVLIGWIFFRANSVNDAIYIIKKIVSEFSLFNFEIFYPKRLVIVAGLVFIEWLQRHKEYPLQISDYPSWVRKLIYYFIIATILLFGVFNYTPFIYFQF